MRFLRSHLKPLPFPLRWLLAIALMLNGAVAPPVMAHVTTNDGQVVTLHSMAAHCHDHMASVSSESAKHQRNKCPCCNAGDACQCGCVVTLTLPVTFPDLRPLAPSTLGAELRVPELAVAPLHRLLRPPIV